MPDTSGQPQIIFAVATGQGVANLPPIREWARPDRDTVVWLESPAARERHLTVGINAVLAGLGVRVDEPIALADESDPGEVAERIGQRLAAAPDHRPVAVLNGGPKVTALGIDQALRDRRDGTYLYGQAPRPELWHREGNAPPDTRPYAWRPASPEAGLADVLACTGHRLAGAPSARLWPDAQPPALPAEVAGYGTDWEATAELHRQAGQRPPEVANLDALTRLLPTYRGLRRDFPQRAEGLTGALDNMAGVVAGQVVSSGVPFAAKGRAELSRRLADFLPKAAEESFNAFRKQILEAARDRAYRSDASEPIAVGPIFEAAVAQRVARWLAANSVRLAPVLESAWHGVSVARQGDGATAAEFDILLVLRNGLLIHIECKSFRTQMTELHAGLQRLQQAGSGLARLAIAAPLPTPFSGEDWFKALHDFRQLVEGPLPYTYLAFDLPGQPREYVPRESRQTFRCPTFEEGLERLLGPCLPS
jgi:hypothetical protein